MGATRKTPGPQSPPATTPEGREQQMIGQAFTLAESQLREGTASAQVLTHFLKMGTGRERLEREKLRRENILLESRANALAAEARFEELMKDAIEAFQGYKPQESRDDYDD